jgi:hypothetical protein
MEPLNERPKAEPSWVCRAATRLRSIKRREFLGKRPPSIQQRGKTVKWRIVTSKGRTPAVHKDSGVAPKLRYTLPLGWYSKGWNASLAQNYTSGYEDYVNPTTAFSDS